MPYDSCVFVTLCIVLSAESVNGRVCPLEGRYDVVAPSGGVTRCYSYLNIGCDVSTVIDVIDTCSRTAGASLLTLPISCATSDVMKFSI